MTQSLRRRAILIQDIQELLILLIPKATTVYNDAAAPDCQLRELIYWIICEEIETIYNYPVIGHNHREGRFVRLYDRVRNQIPNLDKLFSHYVRGPRCFGDTAVQVWINERDLYFAYYVTEAQLSERGEKVLIIY